MIFRAGLLALFLLAPLAAAQNLRSPTDFLGYELGEQFTPHHRVLEYARHVAEASPYATWMPYGESVERRTLGVVVLATPERLAQLETVRARHLHAAGALPGVAEPDAAVVWLSYGVHGNESSSTEAALATLYRLADPNDLQARHWLRDVIVLLDPCLNPDGRNRYVHWYRQTRGDRPNPNPDAWEHHEPWPGGRTNHYFFDLNRDWAWGTQPETRARLALYNRWLPHVHVDFHEQGIDAPYYFAPAAEPRHERITGTQRDLEARIGRNHTDLFDRKGWLYFTRQRFDLLYPGYGDTWPTFNGAVGMTYEQAGSGRAGLAVETAEGDTLTLTERIEHHVATGLSTVEMAARDWQRIATDFRTYLTEPDLGPYRAFVVRGPAGALAALAEHLDGQGIRVSQAVRARELRGRSYASGKDERFVLTPGDLVVRTDGPKGVLASVLFDPAPVLSDSLSYDATAWALPYVYDLDAWALADDVSGSDLSASYFVGPTLPGTAQPYAYLLRWESFRDAQALSRLLDGGVRPRVAMEPFEVGGEVYERGTLVLTRRGNERLGDDFDRIVREAAETLEQPQAARARPLVAVHSGSVTSGPDFGSSDVAAIEAPEVAMLVDDAVSSYALGEVWHYFDRQLDYPLTLLPADAWDTATLGSYDVLILPNGAYDEFLSESRVEALRDWVRAGGRLIALERAVGALAEHDGFAAEAKDATDTNTDSSDTADRLAVYGDRARDRLTEHVPGSVYRVALDPTHPLAFGYDADTYTFKRGADAFTFLDDGWNVGVLREGQPVSGFAGFETAEKLTDSLVFGVQEVGRGRVVYIVDNPLFRGFWHAGKLLFANAVFVVGA